MLFHKVLQTHTSNISHTIYGVMAYYGYVCGDLYFQLEKEEVEYPFTAVSPFVNWIRAKNIAEN